MRGSFACGADMQHLAERHDHAGSPSDEPAGDSGWLGLGLLSMADRLQMSS